MKENGKTLMQEIEQHRIINSILHIFLKSKKDNTDSKIRSAVGKMSGLIGISLNILLSVSKLLVGIIAMSVSITADALNNISDAASSVVTLIGFKLAEKPADTDHPYGHARFEYLSGLAVSVMVLMIGIELAKTSFKKILNPTEVEFTLLTACVLGISILVKLWMYYFNRKLGKMIDSQTLLATSLDSRNDVIATGAVLIAALVEHFSSLMIDGYMGFAVALFIIYSGIKLARETMSPLLGEGANEEMKEMIEDYIMSCPKVLGCHDLMVHDYGPGQRFASIHVEMDRNEDAMACHELIDDMERECMQSHGVHLVIHYDPVVTNDPNLERLKRLVADILKVKDERMSIHDFRMVPGKGHTNLIFDIALPNELMNSKESIKVSLETALNSLDEGTFYTVITFDPIAYRIDKK